MQERTTTEDTRCNHCHAPIFERESVVTSGETGIHVYCDFGCCEAAQAIQRLPQRVELPGRAA